MGRPNCSRPLAYSTARSQVHGGQAHLEGAGQHRAVAAPPGGHVRPGHRLPGRQRWPATTAGSGGPWDGRAEWRRARRDRRRPRPSSDTTSRTSRSARCSTDDRQRTGAGRPRPAAVDQADDHRAVGGPVDQPGGQMGGDQRARARAPAELLEDQGGLGQPQTRRPRPPRAGSRWKTPASPSSAQPVAVDDRAVALGARGPRRAGTGPRTAGGSRRPGRAGTRRPRSPRQPLPPTVAWLLGEPEDPLGHDVALDLGRPGGDGQRDAAQPVLDHGPRRELAEPVGALQVVGGQPGPVRAGPARTPRAAGAVSE